MTNQKSLVRGIALSAVLLNQTNPSAGLSRWTREITRALTNTADGFTVFTGQQNFLQNARTIIHQTPQVLGALGFKANLARLVWYQTLLPRALKRNHCSVFFSPMLEGMLVPTVRQVITIPDLLPYLYPETYPRLKYYFTWLAPQITKRAALLIAISQSAKQDAMRIFKLTDEQVQVIYPAVNTQLFSPNHSSVDSAVCDKWKLSHNRFVLSVGDIRRYKNIDGLIRAFASITDQTLKLAIVGRYHKSVSDIQQLPVDLGIGDRVTFLGRVTDEELAALYRSALAFVFPSMYEGFGIPPIEAMACGCPVAMSNTSSLPEAGGDAALYFDPAKKDEIAQSIAALNTNSDLRAQAIEKSIKQSHKFSWESSAQTLLERLVALAT